MRLLLNEQAYETPVASGLFRYERDGQPTGALEHWRLTQSPHGDTIARVDLDGRASSGDSYLYHWVCDPTGALVNLRFRFFNAAWQVSGQVLFEANSLTLSRVVNGRKWIETQDWSPTVPFLAPSTLGLKLVWDRLADSAECFTLTTTRRDHARYFFALHSAYFYRRTLPEAVKRLEWDDQSRDLWFDSNGWLTRMRRQDGLTAVAAQLLTQVAQT